MTDLLNIHNLKVEFDTDEGRILAVDNVILELQEGHHQQKQKKEQEL